MVKQRATMRPALPTPDIQHDDPDDRLKEQLLLAAKIGWHCPLDIRIVDRIERYIDRDAPEYDAAFREYLVHKNPTWLYDLGYDAATSYEQKRRF
jgi:hypothetical protein